ncbi:hypothetical protein MVES_002199 [Malassezia vespertilionis]|uniref:PCI domain-containing protein n=1 Tax=Malassezia vespertilionis TaxID=2020962 RepID=A0A2N1JBA0_9BASI|nr:hypothetical protein MVES_002199 [Malassezia vespertilionis]
MDDDSVAPVPNLKVQQHLFVAMRKGSTDAVRAAAVKDLLADIEKDGAWRDEALMKRLQEKNETELARLTEAQKKAEESEGDLELHTVLRQRATYLARIGDKDATTTALDEALEKATGLGSKIDLALLKIRVGLFFGDTDFTQEGITRAAALIEEGGDWDRRNRLTAYRAVYAASVRNFSESAKLALEALSTFTATELLDYEDFVKLTILMSMVTLPRRELKKMMESPEVLQTIDSLPHMRAFTSSLYSSEYAAFFRALADVEQSYLLPSRILSLHTQYYVREMRIITFAQLLESYHKVAIDSMAQAFGVTPAYIDAELSRFISAGRLPAVIDKVEGTIENRRPDVKNAQYSRIIKEGDVLLNSLQKLSRTAL